MEEGRRVHGCLVRRCNAMVMQFASSPCLTCMMYLPLLVRSSLLLLINSLLRCYLCLNSSYVRTEHSPLWFVENLRLLGQVLVFGSSLAGVFWRRSVQFLARATSGFGLFGIVVDTKTTSLSKCFVLVSKLVLRSFSIVKGTENILVHYELSEECLYQIPILCWWANCFYGSFEVSYALVFLLLFSNHCHIEMRLQLLDD